jgi:hypothetical protein
METYKENIDYENLNRLYLLHILHQNNIDLLNEYIELKNDELKTKLIAFQGSNPTSNPESDKKVVYKIMDKKHAELEKIGKIERELINNAKGKMANIETIIMSDIYNKEDVKQRIKDFIRSDNIPDFYVEYVANKYIELKELEKVNKPKRWYETKKKYTAETLDEEIRNLFTNVISKFEKEQRFFKHEKQQEKIQENREAVYGGKRKKRKSIKKKKNVKKRKNTKRKRI